MINYDYLETEEFLNSLNMPPAAKVIMMKAYTRHATKRGKWKHPVDFDDGASWVSAPDPIFKAFVILLENKWK